MSDIASDEESMGTKGRWKRNHVASNRTRRSIRVAEEVWQQLERIAAEMNAGRDPISDARANPTMVINLAIRDYLQHRMAATEVAA